MLRDPHSLLRDAQPKLRREAEEGRMRAAEEGEEADRGAAAEELLRQLEGHRAAGAVPGNDVRPVRRECADLGCEVSGEVLDARERLALAVEPRRLQAVQGLILARRS